MDMTIEDEHSLECEGQHTWSCRWWLWQLLRHPLPEDLQEHHGAQAKRCNAVGETPQSAFVLHPHSAYLQHSSKLTDCASLHPKNQAIRHFNNLSWHTCSMPTHKKTYVPRLLLKGCLWDLIGDAQAELSFADTTTSMPHLILPFFRIEPPAMNGICLYAR